MRVSYIVIAATLLISTSVRGQAELLSDGQHGAFFSGASAMMKDAIGFGGAFGIATSVVQGSLGYTMTSNRDDLTTQAYGIDFEIYGRNHPPTQPARGFLGVGVGFVRQGRQTLPSTSLSMGVYARPNQESDKLQIFLVGRMSSIGGNIGVFEDPGYAIAGGLQLIARFGESILPFALSLSHDFKADVTSLQFELSILMLQKM